MCGKFTQMLSWQEAVELSSLFGARVNDEVVSVTPMRLAPVIHLDPSGERVVTPMTWGFTGREKDGRRIPKHMHARGETADRLPTFSDAFHHRRGICLARTFNEGQEIDVTYGDGAPAGRTWTRQWTFTPKGPKPLLIGVIFDVFDVGRGPEYEFVQLTTPANEIVARITDRMPLMLNEDDLSLWLGELRAPIEDVKDLIRTFDPGEMWDAEVEDPTKKPPRPKNPKPKQPDLF